MRNYVLFSALLFCLFPATAQVGIDTSNPQAQLDVVASNPKNPSVKDGILIPRIDKFPASNPSEEQNGMLLFLNIADNEHSIGFYFWNSISVKWQALGGNILGNFYKLNTTLNPNNITDPMYRNGSIGIGTQVLTAKLQIYLNSAAAEDVKKGLVIDNNNTNTANLTNYGIDIDNRSATNGNKYGIKNNVGGKGTGIHYGIYNETYQSASTNEVYGIFNKVGRTFGATKKHYGIYNKIGSLDGQGTVYGIYSEAYGNNSAKVYAGYFAGKVGIGLTPEEEYILPEIRGKEDQILSSDALGNVNWSHNNRRNYSSTASETGDFVITDEISTLRINNTVSSITLPQANQNKGRILTLIPWTIPASSPKNINFLNGDFLYDIINDVKITSITGNQIYTIQSSGLNWVVLNLYKKAQ